MAQFNYWLPALAAALVITTAIAAQAQPTSDISSSHAPGGAAMTDESSVPLPTESTVDDVPKTISDEVSASTPEGSTSDPRSEQAKPDTRKLPPKHR